MKIWPTPAKLDKKKINEINELEKNLDAIIIAYEKPSGFANLSDDNLKKIKELEKELGLNLIAIQ